MGPSTCNTAEEDLLAWLSTPAFDRSVLFSNAPPHSRSFNFFVYNNIESLFYLNFQVRHVIAIAIVLDRTGRSHLDQHVANGKHGEVQLPQNDIQHFELNIPVYR